MRGTPEERFWAKVNKTETCWLWTASRNKGYGQFRLDARNGRPLPAHRVAYELVVGPIPKGLDLDHLCRNPACVNPAHLEPVTHGENMRRGKILEMWRATAARRTHCKHGHPYDEDNIYWRGNARLCRTCRALCDRARRAA